MAAARSSPKRIASVTHAGRKAAKPMMRREGTMNVIARNFEPVAEVFDRGPLTLRQGARASAIDAEINALWSERRLLVIKGRKLAARRREAILSIPWWAAPGYQHINSEGMLVGAWVWYPAYKRLSLPSAGVYRVVRPTPPRPWGEGEKEHPFETAKSRELSISRSDTRRAAQKSEERAAGLPAIDRECSQVSNRLYDIRDRIYDLALKAPNALAAAGILSFVSDPDARYLTFRGLDKLRVAALLAARGADGALAADIAFILKAPGANGRRLLDRLGHPGGLVGLVEEDNDRRVPPPEAIVEWPEGRFVGGYTDAWHLNVPPSEQHDA
jgi:hypothetical protein